MSTAGEDNDIAPEGIAGSRIVPEIGGDVGADSARPPILLLHGVFGTPSLLRPWSERFEAAGYRVRVPALPGRQPSDDVTLRSLGIEDCYEVAAAAYDSLGEPAVVVGHSLGGLLAQRIAASRTPPAVILLAPVPPGPLWTQARSVPHLVPVLPSILRGRPFLPRPKTMREVPLSTLPRDEQDALIPELVRDSGRVFRQMSLGAKPTRVRALDVTCPVLCVSAGQDRNVAPWISRRIATRYGAQHHVHRDLPHWIVAASAVDRVFPPVAQWLDVQTSQTRRNHS
ncbi:pimeloyl-ACP methyl ester carboxylesterase [Mycolicibacterium iranicum]|uniref:Pimeloyl-ACP methyl ester carboxylesterase n=1 Tax=Mycolicibacterium iranicum TaxID=912594 RepID=A0A839QB49_MYCIR|nr:alpha/beta fold hydrolase [Mycolicibacterium iranicum]MBB2991436.1 pimeloyl-ACP methyl ester carboxylesterase [Mycolicibacterium iranicum]